MNVWLIVSLFLFVGLFSVFWYLLADFFFEDENDRKDFFFFGLVVLAALTLAFFPWLVRYQAESRYNYSEHELRNLNQAVRLAAQNDLVWRNFDRNTILKIAGLLLLATFFLISLLFVNWKINQLEDELR